MKDLRDYKDIIRGAIRKVNTGSLWKWKVQVNKQEIKLSNSYLSEREYFSIKYFYYEDRDNDFEMEGVEAINASEARIATFFVGTTYIEDGTIEQCLAKAVMECQDYFVTRY